MAYKIYTKSNYFYIVDTENDKIFEGLAKDVRVRKELTSSTDFIFENVNGFSTSTYVPFASIQNESGVAYADVATFVTFYEENTGNFNKGGATPQKEIILYITQVGTSAPTFEIMENTSDIPNIDITSSINVDLPNVLRPMISIGTNPLFPLIKSIHYTNLADRYDVENQYIQRAGIKEISLNQIIFETTYQDLANGTLVNQGDILVGYLTIKFI